MRVAALMKAALLTVVCGAGPAPGAHAQERGAWRSVVLEPATPDAGARRFSSRNRFSPGLRETPARRARLDTSVAAGRRVEDRWRAMDKAKHTGASVLLVLGGQYVFEHKASLERDPALALSLASGAAVGVAKEWYDRWLGPTRYFSVKDLVADALGLLLGAGVVLL
jgi:uncharacterized protein YfiM (DUF2279 family)